MTDSLIEVAWTLEELDAIATKLGIDMTKDDWATFIDSFSEEIIDVATEAAEDKLEELLMTDYAEQVDNLAGQGDDDDDADD